MCIFFFFFNDTATTEIYTLSLHDALPILSLSAGRALERHRQHRRCGELFVRDRGADDSGAAVDERPALEVRHGLKAVPYLGVSWPMMRGFCPARLSVIACETTTENSGRISLRV